MARPSTVRGLGGGTQCDEVPRLANAVTHGCIGTKTVFAEDVELPRLALVGSPHQLRSAACLASPRATSRRWRHLRTPLRFKNHRGQFA